MSTARLVFAGTLLCLSGVAFAQPAPATQSAVSGIFQNPPAATVADAKSGASASASRNRFVGKEDFQRIAQQQHANARRRQGRDTCAGADPSATRASSSRAATP